MKKRTAKQKRYLYFISTLPCAACGQRYGVVPHHLIGVGNGKMGGKADDDETIPLCFDHHTGDQGIHTLGVKTWEKAYGSQRDMLKTTTALAEELF